MNRDSAMMLILMLRVVAATWCVLSLCVSIEEMLAGLSDAFIAVADVELRSKTSGNNNQSSDGGDAPQRLSAK